MRRKIRTIELSIERERTLQLYRVDEETAKSCPTCGEASSPMLGVDEAALTLGVGALTVFRWIESQRLHFLESETGRVLVCLKSLLELLRLGDGSSDES